MLRNGKGIAIICLSFVAVVSVFFCFSLGSLEMDYNFEKFFPADDPDTEFFQDHRHKFSTDNDFLLIGVKNNNGIYDAKFLQKAKTLIDSLKVAPYINDVRGLLTEQKKVAGRSIDYINMNRLDSLHLDSIWISKSPDVLANWISPDLKSLLIFVRHEDYLSKEKCDELAKYAKALKHNHGFDEMHIAGRAVAQSYYMNLMQAELFFFTLTSLVLLLLFLTIAYRSFFGIIIPVIVVVLSAIWTFGLMGTMGQPFNLVLTMLPTILFVVGMSDVVHIVSKYREELLNGMAKTAALRVTIKEVGLATLLTSVTTAVGFFTLTTARIIPIREFGLYTGIGVLIAFVLAFLVLPSFLVLMPKPRRIRKGKVNPFWGNFLSKSFLYTIRNQSKILLAFGVILVVSMIGISKLQVNNYMLEDLKDSDPLKKSSLFFDHEFSGIRPFELSVSSKGAESLLCYDSLKKMAQLEVLIQEVFPINRIISPVAAFKVVNRAMEGGTNNHYCLPTSEKKFKKARRKVEKIGGEEWKKFVSDDEQTIRIIGTIPDLGGKIYRELSEAFEKRVLVEFPGLECSQTGTAYLIDKNNNDLSTSMIQSLLFAFGIIALIVGVVYKSFKMVLISLIPNIFPLIAIAGFMGYLGIDVKVSTSIIFTIAFGIAVDDTIHFISKLKLELNKNKSMVFAIRRTYLSTGRAIVITTAILCAGFLTLICSSFLGTFYMGLLITLTLVLAVVSDLFLLPILILKFYSNKKAPNKD